jgi:IclR family acetate operon transcriptional repressor
VQSVVRSLRVLEVVSERQPIGVNELARIVQLPVSTVQRILTTLGDAGWIRPTGEASTRWALTARALIVGRRAMGEVGLREAASVPMTRLRDTTQETVNLSLLDSGERMVLVERIDCDQAIRTYTKLGGSSPLHATATGRSVLAALPDEAIEQLIDNGLERLTPHTITDPDALREDIRQIRRVGYAVNNGGNRPNVCAIGAAVLDARGAPLAGVSMSMPDLRYDPERVPEWGALVVATAREISSALGASGTAVPVA